MDSLFKFQAAVSGLQNQPIINAVIDGDDIIYRDYIDISIAVGTPKVCGILPFSVFLFELTNNRTEQLFLGIQRGKKNCRASYSHFLNCL